VKLRALLICSVVFALLAPAARADEKPLWEFGLGAGAIAFPDYRGSDEARVYPVPVPYFVYRGPFLKADRDGLRGKLFNREYVELDLSVSATIPVSSEDNAARRGMPDLKPTLELGPSLEVHLWRSADRDTKRPARCSFADHLGSSPAHLRCTRARPLPCSRYALLHISTIQSFLFKALLAQARPIAAPG